MFGQLGRGPQVRASSAEVVRLRVHRERRCINGANSVRSHDDSACDISGASGATRRSVSHRDAD